jgi:hypothetical protein
VTVTALHDNAGASSHVKTQHGAKRDCPMRGNEREKKKSARRADRLVRQLFKRIRVSASLRVPGIRLRVVPGTGSNLSGLSPGNAMKIRRIIARLVSVN